MNATMLTATTVGTSDPLATGPAQSVPELLAAAEVAADAREWDHAAELLDGAPAEGSVLSKRAFYLSRAARYGEARHVLEALCVKEPQNCRWPYMIGYQYLQECSYDSAVLWLRKAYLLNPRHIATLYKLALARREQGEIIRSKLAAMEVLKLWHALPEARQDRDAKTFAKASYMLGLMQCDRDPRGALPLFEQAAVHDASDHDKHYRLGKTYRRLGRTADALTVLRRAARIKPNTNYIELESAEALADNDESSDAVRCLERGARGVRGWQAWKAARIALRLERPHEAQRLLGEAARDRQVKRSPKYEQLRADVDAAVAVAPRASVEKQARGGEAQRRRSTQSGTGRVHNLKPERGFGFLVDDGDGEHCHFKLKGGPTLSRGQRVRFVRSDTDRGPAARDVQPAN
jgi:tetratricopeptide (TPR) repeat protein/cold shock CspA family protein